jgi:hypothetical protein
MPLPERATRQSWSNLKPFPEQYSRLSIERTYTEPEYKRISLGFIPQRMEDKWFIFMEENTLYLHRSWTGSCIYRLTLVRGGTAHVVSEALANRDRSQYAGGNDPYDAKMLIYLIDYLLLQKSILMPLPPNLPTGVATELHYSHVLGAGQRADPQQPVNLTIPKMLGWVGRWLIWLIKR